MARGRMLFDVTAALFQVVQSLGSRCQSESMQLKGSIFNYPAIAHKVQPAALDSRRLIEKPYLRESIHS